MNRRRILGLVASVVVTLVGTAVLVVYVRGAEERATEGEERVPVLVVDQPIAKGTAVEDLGDRVSVTDVPAKVRADGALASLTSLAGTVAAVDLVPGDQIVSSRFKLRAEVGRGDIPPGMLEVSVALDLVRSVAGTIRTGDTVGVTASFTGGDEATTHLILHKVLVTDVRTIDGAVVTSAATANSPATGVLVTLALDAASVEKVQFAADNGVLWLAREPFDADESGTQIQTRGSVNL